MYVTQTLTFENDAYSVTLRVPTLANIQPLLEYARPQLKRYAEIGEEGIYIPTADDLTAAVNACRPLIDTFTTVAGESVDLEAVGLSEATFLASAALQLYVECTRQSALRKK